MNNISVINGIKNDLKRHSPEIFGPGKIMNSSVVLPLILRGDEYHILLELRSMKLNTQPGEVSFPGGKIESGEKPEDAAIREFSEELCTSSKNIEILGESDIYFAPARGIIHCFVAEVKENIDLNIKNDEVDELFTVPLSFFIKNPPKVFTNKVFIESSENFPYKELGIEENYKFTSNTYELIYYKYDKYVIWGITASIIKNFINKFCKIHYSML